MRKLLFGVVYLILASAPAFADVQLTMQNGRVTIIAKDATVRQILNEWSKVGKTNIVNIERVPGQPLTLELRNVTEGVVKSLVFGTACSLIAVHEGYNAAPTAEGVALATTRTVVASSVLTLLLDYALTATFL